MRQWSKYRFGTDFKEVPKERFPELPQRLIEPLGIVTKCLYHHNGGYIAILTGQGKIKHKKRFDYGFYYEKKGRKGKQFIWAKSPEGEEVFLDRSVIWDEISLAKKFVLGEIDTYGITKSYREAVFAVATFNRMWGLPQWWDKEEYDGKYRIQKIGDKIIAYHPRFRCNQFNRPQLTRIFKAISSKP